MKITIVGTGYVGLVSGTCFSETGNHVKCVDIDNAKVDQLNQGHITIYEPGLEPIFKRNLQGGRLSFTTSLEEGVEHADIIFLALPTPPGEDGSADLSYVENVAREISGLILSYKVIVNKSTVPVGTAERVSKILSEKLDSKLFDVVSNPEFLREGAAVDDFMKPDRVVIGTQSPRAKEMMESLYKAFVRQGNPIYVMDERSSEMTKYAANSYLAARISYMNELANLCELLGADIDFVRRGMGSDSRIGKRFLFPGVGFGGSCFPKDVKALQKTSQEQSYDFKILNAVLEVNETQRLKVFEKVNAFFDGDLANKRIAVWGIAFKPNTDDIREAPSIYTLNALLEKGVEVITYDPEAMKNAKKIFGDRIGFATDMYEAVNGADALLIMTEWGIFRNPDLELVFSKMKQKVIIDGRNLYDLEDMRKGGFYYESIGRAKSNGQS